MNRNLRKILRKALSTAFDAPEPSRKVEFLYNLQYPKATNFELYLSQIGYIRKRFWFLSVLLMIGMILLSFQFEQGEDIVSLLSALLPLLTITGITEISKSISNNMEELEMSCKYNLGIITLIRLLVIGVFHFSILLLSLFLFKDQSGYDLFPYALYVISPFILSCYLSLWFTNHLKSKDTIYICSGVTIFISIITFIMHLNLTVIFKGAYVLYWVMAFIGITVLLIKEIYFLLNKKTEEWNFV